MRKLHTALFALTLLAAPAASHAQVSLGLRLGFAPAMGDAAEGSKMTDGIKSQIPIQLDATYAVTPKLSLGGYASYGFGQTGDEFEAMCEGVDCSTRVVRLGVQGVYRFDALGQAKPWAALGAGYEWGSLTAEADGQEATISFDGFELLNVSGGADFALSPRFAVGPYLGVSVARYSDMEIEGDGTSISGEIQEKAFHQWLQFGVRGSFDL